jgi:hypothetical protein
MYWTKRRFWHCWRVTKVGDRARAVAVRVGAGVMLAASLAGCVSQPPAQPDDICEIFTEKRGWYRAAQRTEARWGTPVHVQMAFTHRESSYVARARPPRTRLLWILPGPRPSSAYGFAQATDAAWSDYLRDTGRSRASRTNFADAMDFIGWYNDVSHRRLGIRKDDAYQLYLAYHEGHGGYARGSWRNKPNVQRYASLVRDRAAGYRQQLDGCEARLKRRRWWWPFG